MRNYSKQHNNSTYKINTLPRILSQRALIQGCKSKNIEVQISIYKYNTEDELGKGYSSNVYRGVEIDKTHKEYAIKVIDLSKFRGSSLEMVEAQIDIHKNLVHQNIIRLFEVIKTENYYYLVLEYCPDGNLREHIHKKKKLSQSMAIQIMQQVLSGYKYLCENNIIHRDLKPANILRAGNRWKISDFGFAIKSKHGFKDRMNVGTPLYMSPQSLTKTYYSVRSDIFSLGVILYEMILSKTPWDCSNEQQLIQKYKTELTLPESIQNYKIREFISKSCQLIDSKRMSKEQMLQFQLKQYEQSSKCSQKSSTQSKSLSTNFKLLSQSTNIASIFQTLEEQFKQNFMILNKEFSFAKNVFGCINNIDCFMMEGETRKIFHLTLFKLLLKLMGLLTERKLNNFQLKNWSSFICSKGFKSLMELMLYYSQQYESLYLERIKHMDIKIIRTINRKFPDLSHRAPFSQRFYEALKNYMIYIIREHNHYLMALHETMKKQIEANLQKADNNNNQLASKIQALESLYTIYCFAQLRANPSVNKEISLQTIDIIDNYQNSQLTQKDYLDLRRLLKNI